VVYVYWLDGRFSNVVVAGGGRESTRFAQRRKWKQKKSPDQLRGGKEKKEAEDHLHATPRCVACVKLGGGKEKGGRPRKPKTTKRKKKKNNEIIQRRGKRTLSKV